MLTVRDQQRQASAAALAWGRAGRSAAGPPLSVHGCSAVCRQLPDAVLACSAAQPTVQGILHRVDILPEVADPLVQLLSPALDFKC